VQDGNPARLRDRSKRDFSAAQTDTFARAKVKTKASVCFGRNDTFVAMLTNDKFAAMLTAGQI
jgi:hypothetical protein